MIRRILLALACAFAFGQAMAQTSPVKTIWFFTAAAKTFYGNSSANMASFAQSQITILNNASSSSGMSTSYDTAVTVSTSACCGEPYMNGDPVTGEMLEQVMGSPKLMGERDAAGADVVVVVSNNGGLVDIPSKTLMDCSKTGAVAAQKAIVGLNLNQTPAGFSNIGDAMGKLQCAVDESGAGTGKAFTWGTGLSPTDCNVYTTIESSTTSSTAVPFSNWQVPEGGLAGVKSGVGPDADTANANMTPYCVNYTGGLPNNTITCAPSSSCSVTGTSATCSHTRTNLDHRGPPTCGGPSPQPSCTTVSTVGSVGGYVSYTCTGGTLWKLNAYSNPSRNWLGFAQGDSTHNAATRVDARNAAVTSTLRNTKIAPMVTEGGQSK